jgi:hypothetical protein
LALRLRESGDTSRRARLEAIARKSRTTWLGAPPERKIPDAIGYDEAWRVLVNVPRAELCGNAGLGQRKTIPAPPTISPLTAMRLPATASTGTEKLGGDSLLQESATWLVDDRFKERAA